MARTNPHHDWPEPQPGAPRSNGAEWESLRNELVALLDQVEDQVATAQARPHPEPAAPAPVVPQPSRHSEALRSVRQAVTRLADRSTDDRPVMRDSVVDAINQIRARQTGAPLPSAAPASTPAKSELADFAKTLDAMGERIESFEARIGGQIDALGGGNDISAQIAQLSEVIEMLAGAVGETGQIRRIEAQIGNLAELIANDRQTGQNATAQRIEDLTGTIEKLLAHQVETSGHQGQQAAQAEERQAHSMAAIEASVRAIYDRIDALEIAQPSGDIERLSRDMAALTEAVSHRSEPESLLAKIDALSARIETIEAPSANEAAMLTESVSVLREVIAETLEPRFVQLEARMDALGAGGEAPSIEAVEAQLRQIARRVDETSAQLKAMATLDGAAPAAPDLEALAGLIAEKTRSLPPSAAADDGVEKADLDALEERLAALFARSETGAEASHLAGVRSSIAQVDNRIARLEAMLNSKPAPAAAAPEPEAAPARPRRKPDDAMPVDPTTGAARRVLGQGAVEDPPAAVEPEAEEIAVEPKAAPGFAIDPETIDRPAKPQSSFAPGRESPFEPETRETAKADPVAGVSSSTRANFIEAARRSARQPEPETGADSKSLIGRAMARFQRSEAEAAERIEPEEAAASEPVVERRFSDEAEDEPKPAGFFSRNRRALLLGTALVVVVAMTVPLVIGRMMPPAPTPGEQAQAVAPTETAEPEAAVIEAPAQDDAPEQATTTTAEPDIDIPDDPGREGAINASDLMSDIRIIEQQPRFTAASVSEESLSAAPTIDPITTAGIGEAPESTVEPEAPDETADALVADLPEIAVPDGIEPEALRTAAEEGDQFAQFEVGAILTEGTLVAQDLTEAAAWYERSAAQGFAPAQYRLGSLYESGRGVERDLDLARLWYQRAAEAGNRMSMHNLASLHAGGELQSQDFEAAAHWFEQAAARGLTDSQFNLGMLYARGLGVEQDFEQSYIWFSLAARSGDQDAAAARDDVARSLEADAIQRLDDTIEAWAPAEIDMTANFAPIGTWDEAFDPGPSISNQDVILRVQMLLGKLGYDVGTPDGIAGPKTSEAIAAFERATGMSESGDINPRLLAVLGSQPV